MQADGYSFMVDHLAKFFHGLHIFGWFHHPSDKLSSVTVKDPHLRDFIAEVGLPHGGVPSLGPNKGFRIEVFRDANDTLDGVDIVFKTKRGKVFKAPATDLANEHLADTQTEKLFAQFRQILETEKAQTLLDIGGRDRKGVDRSKMFPNMKVTVLDILPSTNVDVVGDAHELRQYFKPNSFDAVFSCAVFEHLLMPWKVAVEISTILKPGGVGFLLTHQTLGLHDIPWDFYRFSNTSWDGIFNSATGFEILDRGMDLAQFIIPFVFRPEKIEAEKSAGYEMSAVLFRKIGESRVDWPVGLPEALADPYPG